jgi:formylglycine-generating enzyme required for sulfatase activity
MRMRVAKRCACGLALIPLLAAGTAMAGYNDWPSKVRIQNVKVEPQDRKTRTISFDLSWENSWRYENNHDAAWVVFKVKPEGSGEWQHARLAAEKVKNPAGYGQQSGTPLEFIVPEDRLGVFIRRAELGFGTVAATNVTVVWDLAGNPGLAADARVEVCGAGIEMVYIPEGAFYLNTGGAQTNHFYEFTDGQVHTKPYRVTGEGAIPTGQQPGKLWAWRGAQPEDQGEIPAAFPKGYGAFYCMKTQIKHNYYVSFLNTLTPEQAAQRIPPNSGFQCTSNTYSSAKIDSVHAYSLVSWADARAYASWAAIRPMTEMEWVKIGRGMMEPTTETGDTLDHPSCWDVMDWTGWRTALDRAVSVATPQGRGFKGTNGDGTLTPPPDWPKDDAIGTGYFGGFGEAGHPSSRDLADKAIAERRKNDGWRGVRTAPKED